MRQQQEHVGRDGDDRGGQIEIEEESRQSRGEERFATAPKIVREPPGGDRHGQHEKGVEQAQRPPRQRAQGGVHQRRERRLIVPEVAIEQLAVERLHAGGQVVILVRPQDVHVAQAQCERDGEQRREEKYAPAAFGGHSLFTIAQVHLMSM